jgi:hypothetical protein
VPPKKSQSWLPDPLIANLQVKLTLSISAVMKGLTARSVHRVDGSAKDMRENESLSREHYKRRAEWPPIPKRDHHPEHRGHHLSKSHPERSISPRFILSLRLGKIAHLCQAKAPSVRFSSQRYTQSFRTSCQTTIQLMTIQRLSTSRFHHTHHLICNL